MHTAQREHIHEVIRLVDPAAATAGPGIDPLIRESWSRCVHQHKLDPTRMQEAIILPSQRVREHRERIEEFLTIARHGLEAIHQQVGGLGYCVLLADARGVTVDYLGDLRLDPDLRRTGLYRGSDWNEHLAGPCAIGTAIATGQALVVHQTDHFDATHIPLTCTAAPIYDPLGHLTAVLDISALTSPQAKSSQHLALQLVKLYAHRVESASFLRWFRSDWVLKLHPSPEFVEISPDYLVQEADGGTLFLDEIGDMPLAMQARLLRVLAEREVLPIGATRAQKVDVRVLAATHADLPARVREGRFREDLYYRLAGAQLVLPPLRARRDLPWLVARFLGDGGDAAPLAPLAPQAERRLLAYAWPGNLRELRNALDFAQAMAGPGGSIGLAELPETVLAATAAAAPVLALAHAEEPAVSAGESLPPEALLLQQYLRAARWNISAVAHQMGVARMTVYRRMRRWGIRAPG